MRRAIFVIAVLSSLAFSCSRAGAIVDQDDDPGPMMTFPILATGLTAPPLLPADPPVVTDEQLSTVGAKSATAPAMPADPNLLVVDDDLAQCPNADFTTAGGIQAAITAAAPGAKIRVCPGSYTPISVNKADLWLQAPRSQGGANACHPGDPTQDAIIQGSAASGLVQIVASGVRFQGFTVQGNAVGSGIRTDSSGSGYDISFNEVRGNQYGIDLSTNRAAPTVVEQNCIRDNKTLNVGILSSNGYTEVAFQNNYFSGHMCASISNLTPAGAVGCQALFAPSAHVTASHNTLVNDTTLGFGIVTNIAVEYNDVRGHFGVAVFLTNIVGASVSFNHIDGTGGASQGISVGSDDASAVNAVINSNKIERAAGGFNNTFQFFGFGIMVRAPGVGVENNWIEFNKGSGIVLFQDADGDTVRGNLLVGNGMAGTLFDALPRASSDGIKILSGAVGNTIENNRLGEPLVGQDPATRANVDHDCHDNNPFGANTWRHNVGYTENQPGLCVKTA